MKRIYLFSAFAILFATSSFGQEGKAAFFQGTDGLQSLHVGVKAGANYSNVYDSEGDEFLADPKFGLAGGIFVSIPIGRYLGVQPEVLFSQRGFSANGKLLGETYKITRTSNNLDIPLLLKFKPTENISVLAGPQYSYLLSQKNKYENGLTSITQEEEFDNEDFRKNMLSATGGIDVNFNNIVVSARVGWDLFNNNGDGTTTTPRYKNSWYQLMLGYRL